MKHVVICSGLGDTKYCAQPLVDTFRSAGYETTMVAPRIKTEKFTFEDRVRAVLDAMNRVPAEQALYLAGLSTGGLAVLQAAAQSAQRKVEALVLFAPAMPHGVKEPLTLAAIRLWFAYRWSMKKKLLFEFSDKHMRLFVLNGVAADTQRDRLADRQLIAGQEAEQLAVRKLRPKIDLAGLPPVLVVAPVDDNLVPPKAQWLLRHALLQAGCIVRLLVVPGGHAVLWQDSTERMLTIVLQWLSVPTDGVAELTP